LQRIARASLEEPNSFALNTTAVIAEALDIQPSTLIRFAKEFGYNGFSDLQRIFRQRLIEGAATVRDQVLDRAATAPARDVRGILQSTIRAHAEALDRLASTCDIRELARAVEMLRGARHVYVAGLRRSRPIADYLLYGLMRCERACSLLDFAGGMAGPQTATLGAEDVLAAVAFTPYSKPVVEAVMDAHVSGRRILAITDDPSSPLARCAEVALFIESDVASQLQPISGAIALVHVLLTAVAAP
jgi:DNA-binding MurR/RpiR family transcriptional regulator